MNTLAVSCIVSKMNVLPAFLRAASLSLPFGKGEVRRGYFQKLHNSPFSPLILRGDAGGRGVILRGRITPTQKPEESKSNVPSIDGRGSRRVKRKHDKTNKTFSIVIILKYFSLCSF